MMIVGIDPGLSGAIALYRPEPGSLVITDLPTQTRRLSNKKLRTELDLAALAHWLDLHLPIGDVHAYIEDPHAMPKQGITSAFRFGYVCGAIQAMITAYRVPMTLLPPATWKKALGLSSDKVGCQHKASQILPHHAHLWPLKKHDGRAEAALLAWYGAQRMMGGVR